MKICPVELGEVCREETSLGRALAIPWLGVAGSLPTPWLGVAGSSPTPWLGVAGSSPTPCLP